MKKFWMVWNPANRLPTVRHDAEFKARMEAARLAHKHPGENFFVLESKASVSFGCLTWDEHFAAPLTPIAKEEIPF